MMGSGLVFDVRQAIDVLVFYLHLHAPSSRPTTSVSPFSLPLALAPSAGVPVAPSSEASRVVCRLCLQWLCLVLLQKRQAIFRAGLDTLLIQACLTAVRFAEREQGCEGEGEGDDERHTASTRGACSSAFGSSSLYVASSVAYGAKRYHTPAAAHRTPLSESAKDRDTSGIEESSVHEADRKLSGNAGVHSSISPSASLESAFHEVVSGRNRHQQSRRRRRKSENEDEHMTEMALRILASLTDEGQHVFDKFVELLLQSFEVDRRVMDTRGRLMLRHFCDFLDPQKLYEVVAASLAHRASRLEAATFGHGCGDSTAPSEDSATETASPERVWGGEQLTGHTRWKAVSEGGESGEGRRRGGSTTNRETTGAEETEGQSARGDAKGTRETALPTEDAGAERDSGRQGGAGARSAAEVLQFMHQAVQIFNWILLAAPETQALRESMLQDGEASLFRRLLPAWMHNPVATLALSLRLRQHRLAVALVQRLAALGSLPLQVYVQLDQLVLLFESPSFVSVRLLLLQPQDHPDLVQALVGLSLLLPQNGAYELLHRRLSLLSCSAASALSSPYSASSYVHPPKQISSSQDARGQLENDVAAMTLVEDACRWFDRLRLVHNAALSLEDTQEVLSAPSILEVCPMSSLEAQAFTSFQSLSDAGVTSHRRRDSRAPSGRDLASAGGGRHGSDTRSAVDEREERQVEGPTSEQHSNDRTAGGE
ncbi:HEAT repeat-containing protein [Besnoitia besnoiti]|uniref:HEAT repeat-containing protein n=1 Tax=Besnoitia besnoiti TaxID=94643 RepID=A0A2A9MAZ5_BESBE|nr:HEAT repeat-containing protein [Besnoitia besnoiti]PFH32853.1 HEAT repeat-containing protein [Besnoitia besnoiti]